MNSLISAGLIAGLGVFNLVCIKEMRRKQKLRIKDKEKNRKKLLRRENQVRHLIYEIQEFERGVK